MSSVGPSALITSEHKTQVLDALAKLDKALQEIDMAERAGLTVGVNGEKLTALKAKAEEAKSRLLQIKNVYFPNS